jgi:hypothetical protein
MVPESLQLDGLPPSHAGQRGYRRRVFTGSETVTDVRCDLDIVPHSGWRPRGCTNFEGCDPLSRCSDARGVRCERLVTRTAHLVERFDTTGSGLRRGTVSPRVSAWTDSKSGHSGWTSGFDMCDRAGRHGHLKVANTDVQSAVEDALFGHLARQDDARSNWWGGRCRA